MQSHEQLPVHQVRLRGGQVLKDTTRRAVLVASRDRMMFADKVPERMYVPFEERGMNKQGKPEIMIVTVVGREAGGQAESTPMD